MRIRPPSTSELPLLQEIEVAAGRCFADVGMPEVAADEAPSIALFEHHRAAGLAWVAVDDADLPVAHLLADDVDGCLHIEQVSVHPDHAGRRIGRALIEYAAGIATAVGRPALTLTTFAEVAWNAPYYERFGFRRLTVDEETPGLVAIRRQEAERGLDRWPRLCMRRDL
jgi:GNAT superfamily N-acetyltransferase